MATRQDTRAQANRTFLIKIGKSSWTLARLSRLFGAGVDSPLKNSHVLALRAGYLRTAAFGGPDCRYRYVQASWTVRS